ncbi:MAG: UDP-N-acetylmuramate dehydrogenase [Cyanobacteria bacterium]|nr:UDP-N-acetylmuramate dehydrogenase [Cyanobacteriota bacterium]MDW8200243.1 UDP-N-acetylmuramate dehydrogenase [Cyanobacteriota bacterium SKYGB_h_bin112]
MTISQASSCVIRVPNRSFVDFMVSRPTQIRLAEGNSVIKSAQPLAPLTSYRVGGKAEWYIAPRNLQDLRASVAWAQANQLPITVIGAGSNLLISDRGLPGLVICTRYLRSVTFNDDLGQVTASAGEPIVRLAWQVAERGWRGLEWAVGIPGTVGGAVVMNAGAHGSCTAEHLVSATVLLPNGTEQVMMSDSLGYDYRTSVLQGSDCVVLSATWQFQPGFDPAMVLAATETDLNQRRATQPYHLPSCGSVFRNPEPQKAAKLIQDLGLKGYAIGGAQVSELHANFIVNVGNATAADVYQLIGYVQQQVAQQYGIQLQPEVKILGDFSSG